MSEQQVFDPETIELIENRTLIMGGDILIVGLPIETAQKIQVLLKDSKIHSELENMNEYVEESIKRIRPELSLGQNESHLLCLGSDRTTFKSLSNLLGS